eukprot:NODE_34_length_36538_cov_0.612854.p3 type:complete len:837 gc:universal NODE_34_length_36538_cov_0.612854:6923-4413(-)
MKPSLLKLLDVADISIFLYQINKHPSPLLVDILYNRLETENSNEFDQITMEKLERFSLQLTILPVSFDNILYKAINQLFLLKDQLALQFRQLTWKEMAKIIPLTDFHQNMALLLNTHLYPMNNCKRTIDLYCMLPFLMMCPSDVQKSYNFPSLFENKITFIANYKQMEQKYKLYTTSTESSSKNLARSEFYVRILHYSDSVFNSLSFFSNIPRMMDVLDMQLYYLKYGLDMKCLASPFSVKTHRKCFDYLKCKGTETLYNSPNVSEKASDVYSIVSCTPSSEFMSSAHERPYIVYYECVAIEDLDYYQKIRNTVLENNPHIPSLSDMMIQINTASHLYRESKKEYQAKIVENLKITTKKWKEQWKGLSFDSYADLSEIPKDRKHKGTFSDYLNELALESPYSSINSFHIIPMLHKPGDLRQEKFALQLLQILKEIFAEEHVGESLFEGGLASGLTIYEILSVSGRARLPAWLSQHPENIDDDEEYFGNERKHGMIELCLDTVSVHRLTEQYGSFQHGFEALYGKQIGGPHYKFLLSLVSYSIATYLFNIKDRHNGNILLHKPTGKLIHIDFGFFFNLIPGAKGIGGFVSRGTGFEQAPFKLHHDYIEILGGVPKELRRSEDRLNVTTPTISADNTPVLSSSSREFLERSKIFGSSLWTDFTQLMQHGFKAVKKHHRKLTDLVHMMEIASEPLPCFTGVEPYSPEQVNSPIFDDARFSPELQRSSSVPAELSRGLDAKHNRQASSPLLNANTPTTSQDRISRRSTRASTRPTSRSSSVTSRQTNTNCPVTDALRERCLVHLTDEKLQDQVYSIIDNSIENVFTILYDQYQRITNGIL